MFWGDGGQLGQSVLAESQVIISDHREIHRNAVPPRRAPSIIPIAQISAVVTAAVTGELLDANSRPAWIPALIGESTHKRNPG